MWFEKGWGKLGHFLICYFLSLAVVVFVPNSPGIGSSIFVSFIPAIILMFFWRMQAESKAGLQPLAQFAAIRNKGCFIPLLLIGGSLFILWMCGSGCAEISRLTQR